MSRISWNNSCYVSGTNAIFSAQCINGTIVVNGRPLNAKPVKNITVNIDGQSFTFPVDQKLEMQLIADEFTSIESMAGDIVIAQSVKGNVKTVSGDIEVSGNVSGSASTVSGDIIANSIGGACSTVSGDVRKGSKRVK